MRDSGFESLPLLRGEPVIVAPECTGFFVCRYLCGLCAYHNTAPCGSDDRRFRMPYDHRSQRPAITGTQNNTEFQVVVEHTSRSLSRSVRSVRKASVLSWKRVRPAAKSPVGSVSTSTLA